MVRIKAVVAGVVTAMLMGAVAAACSGPTTSEILQTSEAENKLENAAATASALETRVAQGGATPVSEGSGTGGQGGLAGELRATAEAQATAAAAGGTTTAATSTPSPAQVTEPPPGDALTGTVTVDILNGGFYSPAVIKIKAGTKVTWQNTERSNHQSIAEAGQAEQWNSGDLARLVADPENRSFSHTFTKPGRYTYGSGVPGETEQKGVVFVVE
jgi:plastocyanin